MIMLIFKAIVSGVLIAIISEVARRSPGFGALIASLPLISIFAIIWIWFETKDKYKIADHSEATFWLVIPSLPMFLLIPFLLRLNWNFWVVLIFSILVTFVLYLLTIKILALANFKI